MAQIHGIDLILDRHGVTEDCLSKKVDYSHVAGLSDQISMTRPVEHVIYWIGIKGYRFRESGIINTQRHVIKYDGKTIASFGTFLS